VSHSQPVCVCVCVCVCACADMRACCQNYYRENETAVSNGVLKNEYHRVHCRCGVFFLGGGIFCADYSEAGGRGSNTQSRSVPIRWIGLYAEIRHRVMSSVSSFQLRAFQRLFRAPYRARARRLASYLLPIIPLQRIRTRRSPAVQKLTEGSDRRVDSLVSGGEVNATLAIQRR